MASIPASCPAAHGQDDRKSAALAAARARPLDGTEPVARFTLARDILRNGAMKQAGLGAEQVVVDDPSHVPVFFLDGEEHKRKRGAIARFFTPKAISTRHALVMEKMADELMGDLRATGSGQLDRMSWMMAVVVASAIVGLTSSDRDRMAKRLEGVLKQTDLFGMKGLKLFFAGIAARIAVMKFLFLDVRPAIKERRVRPQEPDEIGAVDEQRAPDAGDRAGGAQAVHQWPDLARQVHALEVGGAHHHQVARPHVDDEPLGDRPHRAGEQVGGDPVVVQVGRAEVRQLDPFDAMVVQVPAQPLQVLPPVDVGVHQVAIAFGRPAPQLVEVRQVMRVVGRSGSPLCVPERGRFAIDGVFRRPVFAVAFLAVRVGDSPGAAVQFVAGRIQQVEFGHSRIRPAIVSRKGFQAEITAGRRRGKFHRLRFGARQKLTRHDGPCGIQVEPHRWTARPF